MTRRLIDISIPIENDVIVDPPSMLPRITYINHQETLPELAMFFPGLDPAAMPNGEFAAVEQITLSTHNGTHLDAPYHYASTMNASTKAGGERAITIDEVPLDWCLQPGVKLDFRHLPDGTIVQPADIEAELARIGHVLKPLEIVLINTRAGSRYGEKDFLMAGAGMGRAATLYLTERGVRVCGTDAWSWDAPFPHTAARYRETQDAGLIWEGHKASMEIGYCHMEKLTNLESLPPDGFTVSCFPTKIKNGSAGWTRAVAIIEE